MNNVGTKIKAWRQARKYTRLDIARISTITLTSQQNIEYGASHLTDAMRKRYLAAFPHDKKLEKILGQKGKITIS